MVTRGFGLRSDRNQLDRFHGRVPRRRSAHRAFSRQRCVGLARRSLSGTNRVSDSFRALHPRDQLTGRRSHAGMLALALPRTMHEGRAIRPPRQLDPLRRCACRLRPRARPALPRFAAIAASSRSRSAAISRRRAITLPVPAGIRPADDHVFLQPGQRVDPAGDRGLGQRRGSSPGTRPPR